MTEQEELLATHLRGYRRRIKVLLAERMLCRGIIIAGVVALLVILLDLLTFWYVTLPMLGALMLLGAVAGALIGYFRPLSDLTVAMAVDQRLGLKDRSSTALALTTDARSHPEFRALVVADALTHLAGRRPQDVFTSRFTREHRIALGMWGAVLLASFLPLLPFWYSPETRTDMANMQQAGKLLQAQAKKIQHDPALRNDKRLMRLAKHMQKLGKELEKNRLPKKEALKRINKLSEEAAKAQKELEKKMFSVSPRDLRTAADAFQRALDARPQEEKDAAERARQKLAKGARREQLSREEREALEREEQLRQIAQQLQNGQLDEATESLRQFGQQLNSSNLSTQQRSALAEAMSRMANATRSSKEISQRFQQAAKGLRQNSSAGLQQAAQTLQGMPTVIASRVAAGEMRESVGSAKQQIASMQRAMTGNCAQGNTRSPQNGNQPGMGNQPGDGNQPGGNADSNARGGGGGKGGGGVMPNSNPPNDPLIGNRTLNPEGPIDPNKRSITIDANLRGGPNDRGQQSSVPYYNVYNEYRNRAEFAVTSEKVPVSERRRVKDYFTALDPNAGK